MPVAFHALRRDCRLRPVGWGAAILGCVTSLLVTAENPAAEYARSANFLVVAPDQGAAQTVLRHAELYRAEIAREWLGEELPEGVGPAMIHVQDSPVASGFTWALDGSSSRAYHRIWLHAPAEGGSLPAMLKHEVTHVVLATQFSDRLPPWADEGIASRYDDAARRAARTKTLAWYVKTDNWPRLAHVLNESSIAPHEVQSYAISASLVDFLLVRGTSADVLAFSARGKSAGWDAAAQQIGFRDSADLEQSWRRYVSDHAR